MLTSSENALGIIFPKSYDAMVPELYNIRLMASIPFASRYRMIDFILSSMVNCGISNVTVLVRNNYFSLMDHLGSGREWDLTRKNGGLHIIPPFAEKQNKLFNGHVEALANVLEFLRHQNEKYVFLSDANIAVNFDFNAMLQAHIANNADVTAAYIAEELPESALKHTANDRGLYYTFALTGTRISKIYINPRDTGVQNFSMNIYCIERKKLIDLINAAFVRGQVYFERDVLAPNLDSLNVQGFKYEGYAARISDMKSYFEENMKLLDDENLDALFSGNPIYTKIRDDNPTRYIPGSRVSNVMIADGCVIEGQVENSVLFRGVKIEKGAIVRNCILMQDTVIKEGAIVDYTITDKQVVISAGKEMKGADTFPLYIAKGHQV